MGKIHDDLAGELIYIIEKLKQGFYGTGNYLAADALREDIEEKIAEAEEAT